MTPLLGRHQVDNALAAIAMARLLVPALTAGQVADGLREVRWPGRLQVLGRRPWVVVDGAHNGSSAEALAEAVGELFAPARTALVVGQLRGHDHAAVLDALCPSADRVFVPALKHPRGVPPEELAELVRRRGAAVEILSDPAAALAAARRQFRGDRDMILVTGSLSLVGEVLEKEGKWD